MYDYLIVGAGFYGSIFAYEMNKIGKKCLVIEKRNHIGGNCYTEEKDGINIHKYGPHIFHCSDKRIINYIKQFTEFNNFSYRPKVNYKGNLYSFPINLNTLNQMYGIKTPLEADEFLKSVSIKEIKPSNLEEWCLSQVGKELYETFIYGYTKKQWMVEPKDLPMSIIRRIPIRTNFDDSYYFDDFQGIPIGGYTKIFEKMLDSIEIRLNTDYFDNKEYLNSLSKKVIYTGPIDKYYDYRFGKLDYRTLRFEEEKYNILDYQGVAGVNYTEYEIPYTRIIEHKHFEFGDQKVTWITKEYPEVYKENSEPYYPINNKTNNDIYNKYKELSDKESNVIFGGRLSNYKYYDMHQVIANALKDVENEKNEKK